MVANTNNNRVLVFSLQSNECKCIGNYHTNVAMLGDRETFHKNLSLPTAVVVDNAGRIFVADDGNDRVVVYLPDGRFEHELTRTPEIQPDARLAFMMGTLRTPRMKTLDNGLLRMILCESDSAFEDPSPLNTPVSLHQLSVLEYESRSDRPSTHAFTLPSSSSCQPLSLWGVAAHPAYPALFRVSVFPDCKNMLGLFSRRFVVETLWGCILRTPRSNLLLNCWTDLEVSSNLQNLS